MIGVGAVVVTTLLGALWYWLVEGFEVIDALYQSVITVSTVGFSEVNELDRSGRIFTVVLIVTGVASVLYAIGGFASLVVESSIRRYIHRRRERNVERMTGHVVVCGFGRTGSLVTARLPKNVSIVVIDEKAELIDAAVELGYAAIEGDCTHDEVLISAGIERAATLIVSLATDSDALSTVLSARILNPALRIVSRVGESHSAKKLYLAGADTVVSPIEMGAQRLVAETLQPSIGTFLDAALHDTNVGYSIEAMKLPDHAGPVVVSEAESATGARIIGVMDHDGQVVEASHTVEVVQPGETVFAVGRDGELRVLAAFLHDR